MDTTSGQRAHFHRPGRNKAGLSVPEASLDGSGPFWASRDKLPISMGQDRRVGQGRMNHSLLGLLVSAIPGVALLASLSCAPSGERSSTSPEPAKEARFVGAETCAPCHAEEARLWNRSHHALAMEKADDKSVLGDFDGARFQ